MLEIRDLRFRYSRRGPLGWRFGIFVFAIPAAAPWFWTGSI